MQRQPGTPATVRGKGLVRTTRGSWRAGGNEPGSNPSQPIEVITKVDDYVTKVTQEPDVIMTETVEIIEETSSLDPDMDTPNSTRKRQWKRNEGSGAKKQKMFQRPKNKSVRRLVQPKNAVMCLNELLPRLTYELESPTPGVDQPLCMSVEVEGQKFRGFGSSKKLAQQAAAEAALISFVKPPSNLEDGGDLEEDKTPWATLASFAIYKLFSDWREGRVGLCGITAEHYGVGYAAGFQHSDAQSYGDLETVSAYLGSNYKKAKRMEIGFPNGRFVLKPAKQLPENAASLHPVMVLHQMKPLISFETTEEVTPGGKQYAVTADIDGQTFVGKGASSKKAKLQMATEAIAALFEVHSTYEPPNN